VATPESESERLVSFPAHALLILQERLREQEAEGVKMPGEYCTVKATITDYFA
jgi:hypothetical protein